MKTKIKRKKCATTNNKQQEKREITKTPTKRT